MGEIQMNLSKWTQIAELVSSFVVVVTLVILILEVQSNTQEIRISNAREVISSSSDLSAQLALDTSMSELVIKGRNEEPLSESEQLRLTAWLRSFVRNFETVHYMFEAGALDEIVLENYSARMRNFLTSNPAALDGIDNCLECYSPSFLEWVDSSISR